MIASRWLRAMERFVFPNVCVACGAAVGTRDPDALICGVCTGRMRRLVSGCPRCAQPLPPVGPCRFCEAWEALAWARSAVWLEDEARAAVHHLKYQGYPALGSAMAAVIVRTVGRPPPGVVVPIPLGPKRRRARGYNQAEALAIALGRLWRLPVRIGVLRRTRETATQTALRPEARAENVAEAFTAAAPVSAGPKRGARAVILIDDVLTTGATLHAAAAALTAGGWGPVGAVTFARALPYELRATASAGR